MGEGIGEIRLPNTAGIAGTVFGSLSEIGINVDMIVQNVSKDSITDISFTAPTEQNDKVEKELQLKQFIYFIVDIDFLYQLRRIIIIF